MLTNSSSYSDELQGTSNDLRNSAKSLPVQSPSHPIGLPPAVAIKPLDLAFLTELPYPLVTLTAGDAIPHIKLLDFKSRAPTKPSLLPVMVGFEGFLKVERRLPDFNCRLHFQPGE
jgi:hypothetical protein